MRKPKAKLLRELDDAQQLQLAEWLLGGMTYPEAQRRIKAEWKVHTTMSALSAYWYDVCVPMRLGQRARSVKTADAWGEAVKAQPGQFDEATIDAIKQRAFELSISPDANPKDVKSLLMLVLKAKDQDLKETQVNTDRERLKLEVRKYEDACKAAQAEVRKLRDKGADLSGDERTAILDTVDEILGLKR